MSGQHFTATHPIVALTDWPTKLRITFGCLYHLGDLANGNCTCSSAAERWNKKAVRLVFKLMMSGSRQRVSKHFLCSSVPEQDTESLSAQGDDFMFWPQNKTTKEYFLSQMRMVSEVPQSFQVYHSLLVALFTWSSIFLNLHFSVIEMMLFPGSSHQHFLLLWHTPVHFPAIINYCVYPYLCQQCN